MLGNYMADKLAHHSVMGFLLLCGDQKFGYVY